MNSDQQEIEALTSQYVERLDWIASKIATGLRLPKRTFFYARQVDKIKAIALVRALFVVAIKWENVIKGLGATPEGVAWNRAQAELHEALDAQETELLLNQSPRGGIC